jgi:LmbE family N-acetylglucosaminyl deacetylase
MHRIDWEDSVCAVIVAHPDDETLWAGGTILLHPDASWTVVTLCRKSDAERSSRFFKALEELGARGGMGDLDDGPEQTPLDSREVKDTIVNLLSQRHFDLIITHGAGGEYTRHLRHEETSEAVMNLLRTKEITAEQIWQFAYEDGGGRYLPRANRDADKHVQLTDGIWQKKYSIITDVYGFGHDSFEAKSTGRTEAFWCFGRNQTRRINH